MADQGARVSLQVGLNWFKPNASDPDAYPPDEGSVLSIFLGATVQGNLWVHGHETSADQLESTQAYVYTAYWRETGAGSDPTQHVIGKSGGNQKGNTYDVWSAAVGLKFKAVNSTTTEKFYAVPTSHRPYQLTDDEIENFHSHRAAPGPLHLDLATPRVRSFWSNVGSQWHKHASIHTHYANRSAIGSIVVIPPKADYAFDHYSERRDPVERLSFDDTDLKAALTEIWSSYKVQQDVFPTSGGSPVVHVWYTHFRPDLVKTTANWSMMYDWVSSVNNLMDMSGTPKAEWLNMTSITWVTSAAYWDANY